ncbi:hypothetical protein J2T38_002265 [Neisseria perflava]|uniref:hypothetical protein n=1 Tax=Neisseria perflava TaxID=33053 RepID=UPI00209F5331|nr:hypothetical protein [Neisseria perflava]MCP1773416.1 hypothetical protein [Neisseria perflava]
MALLTREETLALGARMEHESAGMDDDALLPYLLDVWDKLPEPKQDQSKSPTGLSTSFAIFTKKMDVLPK